MKVSSVIAGASAALVAFQAALYASHGEADLLRPPGAHGEKDFASRCVKCGKCMEACPYIAIKPARDDAGAAVGTPMIDARAQACRLCEDFPCVEACPTNALRDIETRSDVKMGIAVIDEDLCIAFQGMRCEVCYRTCPLIDEAIVIDYRLLWEEYRIFSNPEMNDKAKAINDDADGTFGAKLKMEAKQLAPYEEYLANHGMTWPVRNVNGTWKSTKWRFAEGSQDEGFDEVGVKQYGKPGQAGGVSFYKSANLKPSVVFRPYEPPAQTPSDEYPFYFVTGRLLEHWHTGTMTRRVPELDRALPEALLNMNPDDCKKLGIQDGDMVKVKSTYGEFDIKVSTAGRTEPPAGVTFAPFFAEETLVNLAVQDVYCPLSKEPDYKKTCVSITKL